MKRRERGAGAGRSYLSQMAEPVLAGEQILSVRRRGPGWQPRDLSVVPQEVVKVRQPTRIEEARNLAEVNVERDTERPTEAVSGVSLEARTHENIALQDESRTHQGYALKESGATGRLDAKNSDDESVTARFHPIASNDATLVLQPEAMTPSNPAMVERRVVVRGEEMASQLDGGALKPMARREEHQRTRVGEGTSELQNALLVDARPHTAFDAALEHLPETSSQERQQRESGTTIHIGTVEVRTVVRRPESAVVAPPAIITQPPAAASGPLARSLSWRYGLVQG